MSRDSFQPTVDTWSHDAENDARNLLEEYELLAKSGLFDPMHYLECNDDVAALGVDPLLHYVRYGSQEGRNPSANFDTLFYLEQCTKLGAQPDNPLLHYITSGRAAGLLTIRPREGETTSVEQAQYETLWQSGLFDPIYYLERYRDVADLKIDPLLHYMRFGAQEKRNPSADFDVPFYLEQFTGAEDPPSNPLLHFVNSGRFSGLLTRRPPAANEADTQQANYETLAKSGLFDPTYYIEHYPDVATTKSDPLLHYLQSGGLEGRNPSAKFDTPYYLQQCEVIGERPENPLLHFILSGRAAGLRSHRPQVVDPSANEDKHYELIKRSRLFDQKYYLEHNRDVAASKVDPVLHYMRYGALERRNPNPKFDSQFYLEQCGSRGERPNNPLLHYIMSGKAAGLQTRRPQTDGPPNQTNTDVVLRMNIDHPKIMGDTAKVSANDNLPVVGWALARAGVASVEVLVDGRRVANAYYGVRRDDVERHFPDWKNARLSGFSAIIPRAVLTKGRYKVTVSVSDHLENTAKVEFFVAVEETKSQFGPWFIRGKLTQAEIDFYLRTLGTHRNPHYQFAVTLPLNPRAADQKIIKEITKTIDALRSQVYKKWSLVVVAPNIKDRQFKKLHDLFADDNDIRKNKIDVVRKIHSEMLFDLLAAADSSDGSTFFVPLSPGDRISSDALFEIGVTSALTPDADFIYSDERRLNPISRKVEPFFKPQWSPDLLLSTNYIGRLWCARADLIKRCGITFSELMEFGDYHLVLRLTEQARKIEHVPLLLCERGALQAKPRNADKRALERALSRSSSKANVRRGCGPGIYRLQRAVATDDLVSVIIPTCGTNGLIRTCIESLRRTTAYRNYEIICVDNIPRSDKATRQWLRLNADKIVRTEEPFNWSRYNNLAAQIAKGRYLLFLNDDIEVIEPNWLEAMLEHAVRPEVGVVGAQLLYPNRTIQHAGVTLNKLGYPKHAFRHLEEGDPGYFGLAGTQRNVISVTGACLLTRRDLFEELGRFDEAHRVVNNDFDFCLRVRRKGLRTIYTPYAKLIHHEGASRFHLKYIFDVAKWKRDWGDLAVMGDPYSNPNLSIDLDQLFPDPEPSQMLVLDRPLLDTKAIKKILVVKLDHIGDCIAAFPAMRRLKRDFPSAKLYVLSGSANRQVWAFESSIDQVLEFNFFHERSELGVRKLSERELIDLEQRLGRYHFDVAIDLRKHPETRSILQLSGARYLVGYDYQGQFPWLDIALEWEGDQQTYRKRRHIGDDLMSLAAALSNACRSAENTISLGPRKVPAIKGINPRSLFARRLVCVHPGAGQKTKMWPATYFADLINSLVEEESVNVALVGGQDEIPIAKLILRLVRNEDAIWNLVNKLSLADLPTLVMKSALFVGNDSGPKHIAASLGVPTIGIHSGVSDTRQWGPVGPKAVAVRRDMSCSPCGIMRVKDCIRGMECLTGLPPTDVFRACRRLLLLSPS
jgi:O-antigen biosynthesis protein